MTNGPKVLARRIGGVVVMLLALSPAVMVTAPSAHAAGTASAATTARYEARVIYQINLQRARYHKGRLAAASCPDRYAERWGADLARSGRFYHQSMYPILRGCGASRVAENLARGNVGAEKIVAAWMRSPGHRANILNPNYRDVGFAVVNGTLVGGQTTLVVAHYGQSAAGPAVVATKPAPAATPRPVVKTPAPAVAPA